MSADWCASIEKRLDDINGRILALETSNNTLIRIVVIGLLTIVGAVIGVKLIP